MNLDASDGVLAPGLSYFDLEFLGIARSQATAVISAPGSVALGELLRQEIRRVNPGAPTAPYEPTAPLEALWFGVARYWRKQSDQKSAQSG